MNTSSVRPPSRPIAFTSVADATPVMISETTSGITVIRIAFTHSVPIGASESAARSRASLPDAAINAPPTTAAPSATRTRVLSFMRRSVGKRLERRELLEGRELLELRELL
jgi:hypothetical protein